MPWQLPDQTKCILTNMFNAKIEIHELVYLHLFMVFLQLNAI